MRQLFLHIGDCKTGSTVIQSMLAQGHCTPQGLRLFYPARSAHGLLARSLGERTDQYPERWQVKARKLAENEWDVAVLSTELFEFVQPQKVARALRENLPEHADTVKVIVYVRPHGARVLSQFGENLKLGHDTGDMAQFVDRFLAAGRLQYTDRLAAWKAQFGARLIVRVFQRDHLVAGDVRRDFLAQVLGDVPYSLAGGQDDNAALGLGDLALMRLLQRRFAKAGNIDLETRVAFGKYFGRLLHKRKPARTVERMRLHREIYDRLAAACMADAQNMDATWVGSPCFVPALERAGAEVVQQPQSLRARDYHSRETLRLFQVWGDLIVAQMRDPPDAFLRRLRANQPNP